MYSKLIKFIKSDSGATAIEYALVASLISIAIVGGVTSLGTALQATFPNVSNKL